MSVGRVLYGAAVGALSRARAVARGISVDTFDRWGPELDAALARLPENEACPHELFRLLATTPSRALKKFVRIGRGDEVLAVVGLRGDGNSWTLLLNYVVPGMLFPVRRVDDIPVALESLGVELGIGWWGWPEPPPGSTWMQDLTLVPTYRISCSEDFDAYWKQAKNLGIVRKARRLCEHLELRVNAPGAADWTIRTWEQTWRTDPNVPMLDLEDRLAAAAYLEAKGHHFTLTLCDGDKPVAGHTFQRHGGDVFWIITCRDRAYDRLGVGSALTDRAFKWAAQQGFDKIDIGGEHDYKRRWAPQDGEKWVFTVSPPVLFQLKQGLIKGRARLLSAARRPGAEAPQAAEPAEAH